MTEFLTALADPDLPFLRYAFLSGLLASISFGIIGSFVVVRRISYIAGAISHCALGGIGAGLYLQHKIGVDWFGPMQGAVVVSLGAAFVLSAVGHGRSQREDSVIGALWAVGMAAGLLFMARTPGYMDPMSYLFGNILLITREDIFMILALDGLVVVLVGFLYKQLRALSFDEEFARIRGVKTGLLDLCLLCLTSLTIVLLVRIVGIVMVIALLTLPAAIAANFARSVAAMMLGATVLCVVFIAAGLGLSYSMDLPSGPVIILLAGIFYFFSLLAGRR